MSVYKQNDELISRSL